MNEKPVEQLQPTPALQERAEGDRMAEAKVDAMTDEQFAAFAPRDPEIERPLEDWSPQRLAVARGMTRVLHGIEFGAGGRGAHTDKQAQLRNQQRERLGMKPTISDYRQVSRMH